MRIGIDVGGTKIEGVLLDDSSSERQRVRVPTPAGDYRQTLAAVSDLVARLEVDTVGAATVGVGIPGAISPTTGLVKNANATWLIGRPLHRDLEAILARPVRLANDANCFAVSEAVDGAGADAHIVFGVILGTGVGGGIAIKSQVWSGANAIAGEWGHNPLPWREAADPPAELCYCGRSGCIETYLSGSGLARAYRSAGGADDSEGKVDAASIGAWAEQGEAAAIVCLDAYAGRLARALASVINIVDPDVIVLGGGLSNIARLYDKVPRLWQRWVFSDRVTTALRRNQHGDSGGVRGAAWLWPALSSPAASEAQR